MFGVSAIFLSFCHIFQVSATLSEFLPHFWSFCQIFQVSATLSEFLPLFWSFCYIFSDSARIVGFLPELYDFLLKCNSFILVPFRFRLGSV